MNQPVYAYASKGSTKAAEAKTIIKDFARLDKEGV
jgi:hypothetical protein